MSATTKLLGSRHWSILDLQKKLFAFGGQNKQIPGAFATTIRFNSSITTNPPHQGKTSKSPSVKIRNNKDGSYSRADRSNNRSRPGAQDGNKSGIGSSASTRPPMPSNFRSIPDSERIEGMEKYAAQQFFTKRSGSSTVTNECFSIKAVRMPFREPPPREVPPFVQKAILEHEYATLKYNQDLLEYEQWRIGISSQEDPDNPSNPLVSKPLINKPEPPTKPPFLIQFELRNVREYPSTVDSPHPSFRVTFIIAKKTISKLAVHRNFCRRKLSAAVEMVFRKHARKGYEFMIFAKAPSVTTPQWKLNKLMKEGVSNPRLYGERSAGISNTEISDDDDNEYSETNDQGLPKIRWKNNRPPVHRKWWKHALPNPLGRIQQTNSYLDQFCPKSEGSTDVKQNTGSSKVR